MYHSPLCMVFVFKRSRHRKRPPKEVAGKLFTFKRSPAFSQSKVFPTLLSMHLNVDTVSIDDSELHDVFDNNVASLLWAIPWWWRLWKPTLVVLLLGRCKLCKFRGSKVSGDLTLSAVRSAVDSASLKPDWSTQSTHISEIYLAISRRSRFLKFSFLVNCHPWNFCSFVRGPCESVTGRSRYLNPPRRLRLGQDGKNYANQFVYRFYCSVYIYIV